MLTNHVHSAGEAGVGLVGVLAAVGLVGVLAADFLSDCWLERSTACTDDDPVKKVLELPADVLGCSFSSKQEEKVRR